MFVPLNHLKFPNVPISHFLFLCYIASCWMRQSSGISLCHNTALIIYLYFSIRFYVSTFLISVVVPSGPGASCWFAFFVAFLMYCFFWCLTFWTVSDTSYVIHLQFFLDIYFFVCPLASYTNTLFYVSNYSVIFCFLCIFFWILSMTISFHFLWSHPKVFVLFIFALGFMAIDRQSFFIFLSTSRCPIDSVLDSCP